jgi:PAS domain S-box-containing protein
VGAIAEPSGHEALLSALFASSADVIALVDADTRVKLVSPAVTPMLGYDPDDLLGVPAVDLLHPDDLPAVFERLALPPDEFDAALALVLRVRHANGTWRHCEVMAHDRLDDPMVRGLVLNIRDLSERRATAELLRQERDLVDAVIQASGSLVMVTDRDGRIVRFNRACEALSGYRAGEVIDRLCWQVLVPPEACVNLARAFARLAPDILPFGQSGQWVTRLGERVLIEWSGGAIVDDAGAVSHVVFSGVDVTGRRRAEEELRKSEARLRLLADSATELVSTYEPESGRLTYASPSWRSLGYDPRRLVGTNVTDLTHPDDLTSAATLHARLLAAGDPVAIEARIRTADGEWRWFEALAQLVRD